MVASHFGVLMGFLRGLWSPFRGAAFIARHRLWRYLALPVLLNALLTAAAVALALRLVRQWMGPDRVAAWPFATGLLLGLAGLAIGLLLFVVAQPLFGAPFIDRLTEKVEQLARGRAPATGVWTSVWQAVAHGAAKSALYACALLLTVGLSAVTGAGGLLGVAVYALFVAFDGFDYPLARRGASFREKWGYLVLHPGQTLGYCLGAGLLYLVPFALVVAPAFAAAGATLAYLDTDLDTDLAPVVGGRSAPEPHGKASPG